MNKNMTLDEAIAYIKEKANNNNCCAACRGEHAQLVDWLLELKELRKSLKQRNL